MTVTDAPPTTTAPAVRGAPRHRVADLFALTRPGQWPKNLLVVPLALISAPAPGPGVLARVGWAVLLFILASALVYVVNDVQDRHRDRAHPTKRYRAVASGRVSVPAAYTVAAAIGLVLGVAALAGPVHAHWPIGAYLALNVAYSRGLKHLPLLDVFVVAAGFVLRVVFGCLAAGAPLSRWLLVSVFTVCLLFVLGKRRYELITATATHRPALRGYSVPYLDQLIVFCAVLAVSTFLYHLQESVAAPYTDLALLGSAPFAIFAVARYLKVLTVDGRGGEPTSVLLHDRALVVTALLWAVVLGATLFAARYSLW